MTAVWAVVCMAHLGGAALNQMLLSGTLLAACRLWPQPCKKIFWLAVCLDLRYLWHLATFDSALAAGEMFHFGYELQKAPFLHYGWTDAEGKLQADMPITRGKDRVSIKAR